MLSCQALNATYGSNNGSVSLPNFSGRNPVGSSSTIALGSIGGVDEVALTINELPYHSRIVRPTSPYLKRSSLNLQFTIKCPGSNW